MEGFPTHRGRGWQSESPSVSNILEFLQQGLDNGLAYNSLKVQISALSAMTNSRWALDPVIRFLKAAIKIKPPHKSYFLK